MSQEKEEAPVKVEQKLVLFKKNITPHEEEAPVKVISTFTLDLVGSVEEISNKLLTTARASLAKYLQEHPEVSVDSVTQVDIQFVAFTPLDEKEEK